MKRTGPGNAPKFLMIHGQFAAGRVHSWQLRAGNGKLMASGKWYDRKCDARTAARIVQRIFHEYKLLYLKEER